MPVVCPTITAETEQDYKNQVETVAEFAHRIHIDLSDGIFTPNKLIDLESAWWPVGFTADLHLMFKKPLAAVKTLAHHHPHMIIVHAEADGDFSEVVEVCRSMDVKVGVALLPESMPENIMSALDFIDHVLIFSGNLGHQGGSRADLDLLEKIEPLKRHKPDLEFGWDGGINNQNVSMLVSSGIDILNVGGFIHHSQEPAHAYSALVRIAEETGTT